MRPLALLTLALVLGCAGNSAPRPRAVGLEEEFALAVGQRASLDGGDLAVRFLAVPEDSRCPVDVQCITAGNAVARLRLAAGGEETTVELNTTVGPKEASHAGYTVRLVTLRPEPTAGSPIRQSSYRAVLRIAGS